MRQVKEMVDAIDEEAAFARAHTGKSSLVFVDPRDGPVQQAGSCEAIAQASIPRRGRASFGGDVQGRLGGIQVVLRSVRILPVRQP